MWIIYDQTWLSSLLIGQFTAKKMGLGRSFLHSSSSLSNLFTLNDDEELTIDWLLQSLFHGGLLHHGQSRNGLWVAACSHCLA